MPKTFALLAAALCTYTPQPAEVLADLKTADKAVFDLEQEADALVKIDFWGTPDGPAVAVGVASLAKGTPESPGTPDEIRVAFVRWQAAIDAFVAAMAPLLPEPSAEATLLVRALSDVRMCGTRATGGQRPVGTDNDWYLDTKAAIRRLHLAAASAIVNRPRA